MNGARPSSPVTLTFRVLASAALLTALCSGEGAFAATALSFSSTNGSFLDGNSRMLGWRFEVTADSEVTELGWQDFGQDGLAVAHEVGLWTSAGVLLGSAVVPAGTAGILDGFFRYVALQTSIRLSPGTSYVIAGFDPGAGDPHVWDANIGFGAQVNGFSVDDGVLLGAAGSAIGSSSGSFQFPTSSIGDARRVEMGPNFKFGPTPVPLPASLPMLLAGLGTIVLRRRRAR